jgi:hypothetical protein
MKRSLNKRLTKDELYEHFGTKKIDLFNHAIKFNTTKLYDPECVHYIEFYDRLFKDRINQKISILEIGVKDGESLLMWDSFFNHNEKLIVGLDIKDPPKSFAQNKNITIYRGDQGDIEMLGKVIGDCGQFDIIIDDGSHQSADVITTFEFLFRYGVKSNGIYVIEDLGCSYWPNWNGGLRKNNTPIELIKNKIDTVNHSFWKGGRSDYIHNPNYPAYEPNYFDKHIFELIIQKGICAIKKQPDL